MSNVPKATGTKITPQQIKASVWQKVKSDLIGAIIASVVLVLLAVAPEVISTISLFLTITILISFWLIHKPADKLRKNFLYLAKIFALAGILGLLYVLGLSIYSGSLFTFLKLPIFLITSISYYFLVYKLFLNWSVQVDEGLVINIRDYKKDLVVIVVLALMPFILSVQQ